MKAEERARRILDIVATWDNISKFESAIADEIRQAQSEAFERAAEEVPTNWLHPLLTGPNRISDPPYDGTDIERLLRAIKMRIKRLIDKGGEG